MLQLPFLLCLLGKIQQLGLLPFVPRVHKLFWLREFVPQFILHIKQTIYKRRI